MAKERSPYEGTFAARLDGTTCLGKIVYVNVTNRTCHVKTAEYDLPIVQWVSLSASVENGAEDLTVPTIGQLCLVTFAGSEPYIIGFIKPIKGLPDPNEKTDIENPDKAEDDSLAAGDKIMRSTSGNRIILRAGGAIEVEANKLCRTLWIPYGRIISQVCGSFEFDTDGGWDYWTRDDQNDDTTKEVMAWNSLQPSEAVMTQSGKTDTDGVYYMKAGLLDPTLDIPLPTYEKIVEAKGNVTTKIMLKNVRQVGTDAAAYTATEDTTGLKATYETPSGHIIEIDDTPVVGKITVTHASGMEIQLTKDKAIITADTVQLVAADIELGDGASDNAVLYSKLKSIFDAHTHGTGVGPSTPPLPPNTFALTEPSPAQSAKANHILAIGNT